MCKLQQEVMALLPMWRHSPGYKGACIAEAHGIFVEFTGRASIRCVVGATDLEDGVGYGKTVYEAFVEAKSCAIRYARARKERVSVQLAQLEDTYGESPEQEALS